MSALERVADSRRYAKSEKGSAYERLFPLSRHQAAPLLGPLWAKTGHSGLDMLAQIARRCGVALSPNAGSRFSNANPGSLAECRFTTGSQVIRRKPSEIL